MTALALASSGGHERRCGVQLDTGIMLSMVSSQLACCIRVKRIGSSSVMINGAGREMYSPYQVKLTLRFMKWSECTVIPANVVDNIPECQIIGHELPVQELPEIGSLVLADLDYHSGSKINILFGISYYAPCLLERIGHSQNQSVSAMNTIFDGRLGEAVIQDPLRHSLFQPA